MRRDSTQAMASFADDTTGDFRGDVMDARLPAYLGVADLEARAHDVEQRIKKLDHRPRPTPSELRLTTELKKVRLAVKDRLSELRGAPDGARRSDPSRSTRDASGA